MNKPLLAIIGLLLLFAAMAWLAIDSKSPTYDEPLHVASSLAIKQNDDFRIDPEDPALFKRWMSLGQPRRLVPTEPFWDDVARLPQAQWAWSTFMLFSSNGTDAGDIITHARLMMLLCSLALGAVIAAWTWRLAGPAAAVVAVALFALDPNFLAHSALAKNDVVATLGFVSASFALWLVGDRVTLARVAFLLVAAGVTFCVKFSGVLLAGVIPITLLLRVLLPGPWPGAWRGGVTRAERFLTATAISVLSGAFVVLAIWATYGFRYAPSPDPSFRFDLARRTVHASYLATVDYFHLLPSAYTFGLAYTIDSTTARAAFLLGKVSPTGFWYYFPFAMAVKTPLATLVAVAASIVYAATHMGRASVRKHGWAVLCLMIPAAIYCAAALRSTLNIGVRHMLPVYPLAFIAVAAVLSRHRRLAIVLCAVLAIESFSSFPNYLPFFNAAAGGSRGGIKLLADSNLDWGQDLKLVAAWQAEHPHVRLYLDYFGTVDPNFYGIRYTNTGAGYAFDPRSSMPDEPGVVAVSATHLQGIYVNASNVDFYEKLRAASPEEVLGGSIYLYKWPLAGSKSP